MQQQFEYGRNIAIINALWIVAASVYAFLLAAKKDRESSGGYVNCDFLGAMLVFYQAVCHLKKINEADRERFRATLHRVSQSRDEHEQIIPYVGWKSDDPRRGPGRCWPNSLGLVGQAVRVEHGDSCLIAEIEAQAGDEAAVRRQLVKGYGYSDEQAQALCKGRVTSMVVPIRTSPGGSAIAVLYCDSSEPGFFASKEMQELAVVAASGIASLVRLRFPKGGPR